MLNSLILDKLNLFALEKQQNDTKPRYRKLFQPELQSFYEALSAKEKSFVACRQDFSSTTVCPSGEGKGMLRSSS